MFATSAIAGPTSPSRPPAGQEVSIDLDAVPVSEVVQVIMTQLVHSPYVTNSDVTGDRRLISLAIRADGTDGAREAERYLRAIGLTARKLDGVYVVVQHPQARASYVYRPRFRDAGYLTELLRPAFPQAAFSGGQAGAAAPSTEGVTSQQPGVPDVRTNLSSSSDALVYVGPPEDVDRLKGMLGFLDQPAGEVEIVAAVHEVGLTRNQASGVSLASSILSKRFGLQVALPAAAGRGASAVTFTGPSFEAVLEALSGEGTFRTITRPSVRTRSGGTATFNAGQQVPTLGGVSFAGASGTAVQNVQYRDSGVIFTVRPTVRVGAIDLDLNQEVSNFQATTTGVDGSPTLIRRSLQSQLSVQDGEIVVIGGLLSDKSTDGTSGLWFLPAELRERSSSAERTEIVVVLQARRVAPPGRPRVAGRAVAPLIRKDAPELEVQRVEPPGRLQSSTAPAGATKPRAGSPKRAQGFARAREGVPSMAPGVPRTAVDVAPQ